MPKEQSDHAFCAAAQCPVGKRKIDFYDEAVTGFVLECRVSGGKSYYLRFDHEGRQKRNPAKGVSRPPLNNARERYLTAEEAARLINATRASRNRPLPAIVGLLLLTGMRVSELLSTRWEHVDLERRGLFIPTSKTGRSRHIPWPGGNRHHRDTTEAGRLDLFVPKPRRPAEASDDRQAQLADRPRGGWPSGPAYP